MTYLLSLLTSESPQESTQILCYYINNTSNIQVIRTMSGARCHFERVVFSKERILFEALSESYLEIYSFLVNKTRLRKIGCKSLQVNEGFGLNKTL